MNQRSSDANSGMQPGGWQASIWGSISRDKTRLCFATVTQTNGPQPEIASPFLPASISSERCSVGVLITLDL